MGARGDRYSPLHPQPSRSPVSRRVSPSPAEGYLETGFLLSPPLTPLPKKERGFKCLPVIIP
ncbi:hypothetical protein B9T07_24310 [Limnospira fusiformis CCALA 023]|nr:hypothetical protein AP285_25450 [Arthrospira platensis YZ]KDR55157.1 hypothetical protein APPUASWS_023965 [Arthrospira platensis str. Paraca]